MYKVPVEDIDQRGAFRAAKGALLASSGLDKLLFNSLDMQ